MTARLQRGRAQHGQATVEFVALVLLCCLALGALFALKGGFVGRSFGGFLARHMVCAVGGRLWTGSRSDSGDPTGESTLVR